MFNNKDGNNRKPSPGNGFKLDVDNHQLSDEENPNTNSDSTTDSDDSFFSTSLSDISSSFSRLFSTAPTTQPDDVTKPASSPSWFDRLFSDPDEKPSSTVSASPLSSETHSIETYRPSTNTVPSASPAIPIATPSFKSHQSTLADTSRSADQPTKSPSFFGSLSSSLGLSSFFGSSPEESSSDLNDEPEWLDQFGYMPAAYKDSNFTAEELNNIKQTLDAFKPRLSQEKRIDKEEELKRALLEAKALPTQTDSNRSNLLPKSPESQSSVRSSILSLSHSEPNVSLHQSTQPSSIAPALSQGATPRSSSSIGGGGSVSQHGFMGLSRQASDASPHGLSTSAGQKSITKDVGSFGRGR